MTLEPGDVILTGTPAGADVVEPGDVVEVELEGVGTVTSTIVEAGAELAPLSGRSRRSHRRRARRRAPASTAPRRGRRC